MHLFALLIAASFATQFVAPSDNAGLTVAPASIFNVRRIIPTLTLTPTTSKPAADADLYFRLTVDGTTYPVTGSATTSNNVLWTATAVDLLPLGPLTAATPITVETSASETVWTTKDTATIAITAPAFTVTKKSYTATEIDAWNEKIALTVTGVAAAAPYMFVLSNSLDIDPATMTGEINKTENVPVGGAITVDFTDLTDTLDLTVGLPIYVYAAPGNDDEAAKAAVALAPEMITVTPDACTLSADTPLHLSTVHRGIAELGIKTTDNKLWPEDAHYRITHAGAEGKKVEGVLAVDDIDKKLYLEEDVDLTELLPLTAANPVKVEVSLDGKKTWLASAVTLNVKTPVHTVATTSYTVDQRTAWNYKVKVTLTSVVSSAITVILTDELDLTAIAGNAVKITGTTDATGMFEAEVATGDRTKIPSAAGTVFYVYAAAGDNPTAITNALAAAPVGVYIVYAYTFTPVPANILYFDTSLPSLKITPNATATLPATVGFVLTKAGGSTEVTGTIEKDTPGGQFWITSGAVDLTPLGDLTGASPLTAKFTTDGGYSWLVSTATITVAQPLFSVEPEEVQFDEIADFTSIELTFVDTTIATKIKVVLTKTLGGGTAAQKVELETAAIAAEGVATLEFTSTDIAKLSLAGNDILYVYASPTSYDDALTKAPAPIAIKPAPTTFTFGTTTVVWAKTLTIPAITDVAPTPTGAWTGLVAAHKLWCKYSVKTADSNAASDPIVVEMTESAAPDKFTIPATVISGFELENGEHTIVVEISEDNKAKYLTHKKEISITKKPIGTAEFTATPESIEPTATKATIEVTKKIGTWAADVYFFFSTDPFEEDPDDLTKMQKATEVTAGSKYSCEYTLPTVEPKLKKGDTLYVYVKHTVTTPGDSNTPTWLPVPVGIPIGTTEPPKADFTVTPDKIDLKKTKGEVELKVTETVATGGAAAWAAEVHVVVSQKKLNAAPTLSADTKATADAKDYKIKYDVSKADPKLKKDDVLYVYVSHTVSGTPLTGTWLEVPAEIKISAAGRAAPLFSLLAAVLFCLVKLF